LSITLYDIMQNYNVYHEIFYHLSEILEEEYLINIDKLFYLTLILAIAYILLHFILVFICYRIIQVIRLIAHTDSNFITQQITGTMSKYLSNKLTNLKKLLSIYTDNPFKIMQQLRNNRKEYITTQKPEKGEKQD